MLMGHKGLKAFVALEELRVRLLRSSRLVWSLLPPISPPLRDMGGMWPWLLLDVWLVSFSLLLSPPPQGIWLVYVWAEVAEVLVVLKVLKAWLLLHLPWPSFLPSLLPLEKWG